jgi:hypothetical protein
MAAKHYGLRLTLGGAPNNPHIVEGVLGVYRPDRPTPVGGPGEVSVEVAKRLEDDKSVPLELVELTAEEVTKLRPAAKAERTKARKAAVDARKSADGHEAELAADQLKATR